MRLTRIAALPLLILAMAAFAPGAGAATIVGLDFGEQASGAKCEGGAGLTTSVPKGIRDYTVPAGNWVITSWSTSTAADAGTAQLKVYRPLHEPGEKSEKFLIIGQDGPYPVAAHSAPTFPASEAIRVRGGDMIGIAASETNCRYELPGQEGFRLEEYGPEENPPVGFEGTFDNFAIEQGLQVTAAIEPDEDGDGFGEETQDACPKDAATRVAPCPVAPAPPAVDTRPAVLSASSVRTMLRSLTRRAFLVRLSADEQVTFTVSGTVAIKGGAEFRLTAASGAVETADAKTQVRLALGKGAATKLVEALEGGRRVLAEFHIEATDRAGNPTKGTVRQRAVRVLTQRKGWTR